VLERHEAVGLQLRTSWQGMILLCVGVSSPDAMAGSLRLAVFGLGTVIVIRATAPVRLVEATAIPRSGNCLRDT
jgi:hypothetical protein